MDRLRPKIPLLRWGEVECVVEVAAGAFECRPKKVPLWRGAASVVAGGAFECRPNKVPLRRGVASVVTGGALWVELRRLPKRGILGYWDLFRVVRV